MEGRRVNWFGLAGGTMTIVLVIVSSVLANPWWHLTVGQGFLQVVASPLDTNLSFLGEVITIPIIWALNLTCLLSLIAGGIAMLIYSFFPTREYSMHLLGFAYKKPLFVLLAFVISLFIIVFGANALLESNIPLSGSTITTLPASVSKGASINVPIAAEFTWVFWLAIISAILCIGARVYHRRVVSASSQHF